MEKKIFILTFFLLLGLSAFSQHIDLCDYPEPVKQLQPELLREVSSECNCDCDSLNRIHYKKYVGHIKNDTVTTGHSAIVSLHFLDTIPCSEFYINHIFIRVYRIDVDSILLIDVYDDFSIMFKEDLLQCSYLIVLPCTEFNCPDFHWKTDRIYTVGINPGFGINDMILYDLYNNGIHFIVDNRKNALYCQYLDDERVKEMMIDCLSTPGLQSSPLPAKTITTDD